ncbi:pentapeptide repeat-containing protein [Micromonospora sp. NPDC093277]|uniref:pentapeptide repeat-containing protein n=1 Tax=Micromonospora sp. NPDC093277 TaxID=3364291 RepID=UPI00382A55AD
MTQPQPPRWETLLQQVIGAQAVDRNAIAGRPWLRLGSVELNTGRSDDPWNDPVPSGTGDGRFTLYRKAIWPHGGTAFQLIEIFVDYYIAGDGGKSPYDIHNESWVQNFTESIGGMNKVLDEQTFHAAANSFGNVAAWLSASADRLIPPISDINTSGSGFEGSAAAAYRHQLQRVQYQLDKFREQLTSPAEWARQLHAGGEQVTAFKQAVVTAWQRFNQLPTPTDIINSVLRQLEAQVDDWDRTAGFANPYKISAPWPFQINLDFGAGQTTTQGIVDMASPAGVVQLDQAMRIMWANNVVLNLDIPVQNSFPAMDEALNAAYTALANPITLYDYPAAAPGITGPDIGGPDIGGPDLGGPDLGGPDFEGGPDTQSGIDGPTTSGGTDLPGSNLPGPDASGSNLSGSNLSGSDLDGSSLSGSDLTGSGQIDGPDLTGDQDSGIGPEVQTGLALPDGGLPDTGAGPSSGLPTTDASFAATGFPQSDTLPNAFDTSGPSGANTGSDTIDGLPATGGPIGVSGLALPSTGPSSTRSSGAGPLGPVETDGANAGLTDLTGLDAGDRLSGVIGGPPTGSGLSSSADRISGLPAGVDNISGLATADNMSGLATPADQVSGLVTPAGNFSGLATDGNISGLADGGENVSGVATGGDRISGLPAGADRSGFLSTGIPDLDNPSLSGLTGGQSIGDLSGGTLRPGSDIGRSAVGTSHLTDPFGLNGPASSGPDLAGLGPAAGGLDLPSTSASGMDLAGLGGPPGAGGAAGAGAAGGVGATGLAGAALGTGTGTDIGGLTAAGGALAGAGNQATAAGANPMGGMPFMPPMGGGMGGQQGGQEKERERTTWLAEEEEVWGTDPDCVPAVLGRDGTEADLETQVTWEPAVTTTGTTKPATESGRPARDTADRAVERGR